MLRSIPTKKMPKGEMAQQAAMISVMLLYSMGLAKFQYLVTQERYAKYVVENAKMLGFKPPSRLDKRTIELMQASAKAIARLQNQAFQIFNHHEYALEIFPKVCWDLKTAGLDMIWDLDTPERLKDIIFANREKYNLDNFDFPRGKELFACNLSDRLYQDTESGWLDKFLKEAKDQKIGRFVFYPKFKSFFESPPPERQPRGFLFKKEPAAPIVGGGGKIVGVGDYTTLSSEFRKKTIVVGYPRK